MNNGKRTEPKMESQPRHQPIFDQPPKTGILNDQRHSNRNKRQVTHPTNNYRRTLFFAELGYIEMVNDPVTDRS